MDVPAQIAQWLATVPELAASPVTCTEPRAHADLCTDLSKLISALQHLRSQAMAAGARNEVDRRLGATSMGALVARSHGGDRHEADAAARQGEALVGLPTTQHAASQGDLTPKQAALIAATMHRLPEHLSKEQRSACESHLVDVAQRHSLRALRTACDRISAKWVRTEREVDINEGAVLEQREAAARAAASFSMVDAGDGTHKGWFVVPEAQAALLRTALEAISAPRRDHLNGFEDQISYRQRLGQAFTALCDHLPTEALPQNAGMAARVVVTLDHASLTTGQGVATLSTGARISAPQARIMAANAGVIPAVLGGPSLILDLGRSRRLYSESQRIALGLRDGGCTFPGCDRPPSWCETHHAAQAWSSGGKTDLADGTLLCWHHHRHVEQHHWQFRLAPDGVAEWTPPASVDPHRRPRRNARHRPLQSA